MDLGKRTNIMIRIIVLAIGGGGVSTHIHFRQLVKNKTEAEHYWTTSASNCNHFVVCCSFFVVTLLLTGLLTLDILIGLFPILVCSAANLTHPVTYIVYQIWFTVTVHFCRKKKQPS